MAASRICSACTSEVAAGVGAFGALGVGCVVGVVVVGVGDVGTVEGGGGVVAVGGRTAIVGTVEEVVGSGTAVEGRGSNGWDEA